MLCVSAVTGRDSTIAVSISEEHFDIICVATSPHILDETVLSDHECGEISENFTYLSSEVRNDGRSSQEVVRRIGLTQGVMDLLNTSIWRCRYLCRRTNTHPCILYIV